MSNEIDDQGGMIRGVGIKNSRHGSVSGIDIICDLSTQKAAAAIKGLDREGAKHYACVFSTYFHNFHIRPPVIVPRNNLVKDKFPHP